MRLTPEYRSIGQENFYAAIGSDLLRRDLLTKINAQGLKSGAGLGAELFGYGTIEKPVRVAVIGTGDQGGVLIGAMNPKYVQVVAIADIRPFNHHRAFHGDASSPEARATRPGLIAKFGWKDEAEARQNVKVFGDYKELLDFYKDKEGEEGIEAVVIALPLFLHAPAAVAAMKQGCHVLTEKLMARTVAECKEMARASEQYKKHCVTGHQRHYNVFYDHVVKMIQSGVLGNVHYIRAQCHRKDRPGADSWKPAMPQKIKPEDARPLEQVLANFETELAKPGLAAAAKGLLQSQIAQTKVQIADEVLVSGGEYNGFTYKSAEAYGYKTAEMSIDGSLPYQRPAGEELIRWRLYNRTNAGLMAELQLDAASIFLAAMVEGKKRYPMSVSATETRTISATNLAEYPVDRDAGDHIHCVYDYPADDYDPKDGLGKLRKITVAYASICGNEFGGYGETLFGTKGTLVLDTEQDALLYERAAVDKKTKVLVRGSGASRELYLSTRGEDDPYSAAIGVQAAAISAGRGYCEQIEHWAYCIRENPDADTSKVMPRCHPEVALTDAVISLTTNIASRLGDTVEFDPAWFDIKNDATPEAKYAETDEEKKRFTPNLARYA